MALLLWHITLCDAATADPAALAGFLHSIVQLRNYSCNVPVEVNSSLSTDMIYCRLPQCWSLVPCAVTNSLFDLLEKE